MAPAERATAAQEEEQGGWRHLIGQLDNQLARGVPFEVEMEQLRSEISRGGRPLFDAVRSASVSMRRPAIPPWHG